MKSMTGFGRGKKSNSANGITFTVELSSVNRKQFEFRCSLPRELSCFEPLMRTCVSETINRGAVNGKVQIDMGDTALRKSVKINSSVASGILEECVKLKKQLKITGSLEISDLVMLPGVIENTPPNFDSNEIQETFQSALNTALDELVIMRTKEGRNLSKDLMDRINKLQSITSELRLLTKEVPAIQKAKLLKKLNDNDIPFDPNDDRILKEVIIYSDKSDVSEELTRLMSHFRQFEGFIAEESKPIGRSMDFLIQEINREITTLSSKAQGIEISPLVVQFKTELEKIREQVQNIE